MRIRMTARTRNPRAAPHLHPGHSQPMLLKLHEWVPTATAKPRATAGTNGVATTSGGGRPVQRARAAPQAAARRLPPLGAFASAVWLGAASSFVGDGKVTRTPPEKSTGLYSSGTDSCMSGLFL